MHSKSVLVIDDDESISETIKFLLEHSGYTVFTALNGKAGLDLLVTIPKPDLILVDLMMPVMSGREFIAEISKDAVLAAVPLVILTASSNTEQVIQAKEVIRKPMDLNALLKAVKHWCNE